MGRSKQTPSADVYVLRSLLDHKRYIGLSEAIPERLVQHNAGKVVATKRRRPLVLTYVEHHATRPEARNREKYFKTGAGRRFLDRVESPIWSKYLKNAPVAQLDRASAYGAEG